jgi:hypothetical protein
MRNLLIILGTVLIVVATTGYGDESQSLMSVLE